MTNLYKDADNIESRHRQVASVFDAGTMLSYSDAAAPSLLTAILHEITHNLGPASDYRVHGRTDATVFGGPIASMLEELKAETGALFFLQYLRSQGLIDATAVANGYTEDIAWALGHISRGMYTGSGARAAYGNLAAIQVGLLLDAGALSWDADAVAADGKERGALIIHQEQMGPAVDAMMKQVAGIKARGDKAAALALIARYVDSSAVVPHAIISERMLREPKASFVYAVRN